MERFEWNGKWVVNYGEIHDVVLDIVRLHREYGDASNIAIEFVDDYATWLEKKNEIPGVLDYDGRGSIMSTIGYIAGYEDTETKHLIFELFQCEHPVFGTKDPTPEEAFEAGQEWAKGE